MKTLKIIHWIVEVIVLSIIGSAVLVIAIPDFREMAEPFGTIYTIAQVVIMFIAVPSGIAVAKGINFVFKWIEERIIEEKEA